MTEPLTLSSLTTPPPPMPRFNHFSNRCRDGRQLHQAAPRPVGALMKISTNVDFFNAYERRAINVLGVRRMNLKDISAAGQLRDNGLPRAYITVEARGPRGQIKVRVGKVAKKDARKTGIRKHLGSTRPAYPRNQREQSAPSRSPTVVGLILRKTFHISPQPSLGAVRFFIYCKSLRRHPHGAEPTDLTASCHSATHCLLVPVSTQS